jgi:hypothetical protein
LSREEREERSPQHDAVRSTQYVVRSLFLDMTNGFTTEQLKHSLPAGAEGHFRLLVYGVMARLLANLRAADAAAAGYLSAFPFLAGYDAALRSLCPPGLNDTQAVRWWDGQLATWEDDDRPHLPLRALRESQGLGADELRMLIAAGLVEEDIRFGALFAALQTPLAARRPCTGVLGWLLAAPGTPPTDSWPAARALLDAGLLTVENRADPRAEWLLRVPPMLWDALRGHREARPAPGLERQAMHSFPPLDGLVLPPALLPQISRLPDLLASGDLGSLVLRGMAGSGRRTLAGALARALGHDLLLCANAAPGSDEWRSLGPLATLTNAMPLLRCDPGPGEALDLPLLPGYSGPVALSLGQSGGLRGPLVARALSLHLPPADAAARRRFWLGSSLPVQHETLDEIVQQCLLNGGHISRAAPLAATHAALAGRESIELQDVRAAARSLNRQALETLAAHLEPMGGWDDVIVGAATDDELRGLVARCRAREALRDGAGPAFGRSLNRGVRALFSGPSGTGKTLTARVLAAILGMDLYRVDLAAVVNKYIGETERNLNQVLSRAEELDVLLLLDEGDALMTARTEVRSANDRYANLETNYLLQRLESYEGIVIITTNASQRIDAAFLRRLDATVEFALPAAAERLRIWRLHLPPSAQVEPWFLEEIANRCTLSGGQIRNAALHATLLALDSRTELSAQHLEAGLRREYRKAGAAYPLRESGNAPGQVDMLRQFAGQLGRSEER